MSTDTLKRASAARYAMLSRGKKPINYRQLADSIQRNIDAMVRATSRPVRPREVEDQARDMIAAGLY